MDRRTFFGLIPAAALTSKALGTDYAKISTSGGPIYKGYRIWEWTGWKYAQGNSSCVGQWLAAPVDAKGNYIPPDLIIPGRADGNKDHLGNPVRPLLYVSVPGGEEAYLPGWLFDISAGRGQVMIETRTPEHIKERERRKGLRRMFRLIDRTVR